MLALLAALSLGAVVAQDTVPEPVVIDLRIGRITGTTVQGYRVRSEVLLPLSQFFQLVEIRHRITPDGRLEATVDPSNPCIRNEPQKCLVQFWHRRVRIEREIIPFGVAGVDLWRQASGRFVCRIFRVQLAGPPATVIDPNPPPNRPRLRREAAREA